MQRVGYGLGKQCGKIGIRAHRAAKRMHHISQHPAADHAVKRQQDKAGGHAHAPHPRPQAAGRQRFKRIHRIFAAFAADIEFCQQHGQAD